MVYLCIFLIILAGISKAVMDKIQFHYSKSIFKTLDPLFWNPQESWKNKWRGGDPDNGEKFFGSSTFFVLFTDAWHLFQSICYNLVFAVIFIYEPITNNLILDFIILRTIFNSTFELFFSKVFSSIEE